MNIKKHYTLLIILPLIISLFSCSGLFGSKTVSQENSDKTYISVKVIKATSSRNIGENDSDTSILQALTDFILTGKYQGEASQTLISANSASEISSIQKEIEDGNWNFTLSANYKGIVYSDTKEVSIEHGKNNVISFILRPEQNLGGYNIGFSMPDENIVKVQATFQKADGSGTPIVQTVVSDDFEIDTDSQTKNVYFIRDLSKESERVEAGMYLMHVDFFADENDIPVNTREEYLCIAAGRMTSAFIAIDLNKAYTIEYKDESGNILSASNFESGIILKQYSVRSEFSLPKPKNTGKLFFGWKELDQATGALASSYTTKIEKQTKGNKIFVADYKDPVLFVASSGNDSNDGWTITTALKTVEGACGKIVDLSGTISTENYDWTIKISGDVSGIPASSNYNYGTTKIPNTLTSENAKSLLITGVTVHNEDPSNPQTTIYVPEDKINNHRLTGNNAVIVEATIPVTFTNIMITGGQATDGAGLKVVEGATVKLGDDAWIIGNFATSNGRGGGIRNEGTVFIYGTAVIGNRNATTYAKGDSNSSYVYNADDYQASQVNGNYSANGGGIYNGSSDSNSSIIAKLYLGYSGYNEKGDPVEQELKAGLFANGAIKGGAIYNAPNSQVYIASGYIKYNTASDTYAGGGIYNQKGKVKMTDGYIINNRADGDSGSTQSGGGFFNEYSAACFIMEGGVITDNYATGNGGGIHNGGKVFISGNAVIGNDKANSLASDTKWANKASKGGGIYNNGQQYGSIDSNYRGELYIGYVPGSDGITPVKADYSGGIYQNYSTFDGSDSYAGGGAIYSSGKIKISGGTIAWNYAKNHGGAIVYSESNTTFFDIEGGSIVNNDANKLGKAIHLPPNNSTVLSLSGDVLFHIRRDDNNEGSGSSVQDIEQEIYVTNGKIELAGALAEDFKVKVTLDSYSTSTQILKLGTDANTSIETECEKFKITPQVETTNVGGTDVTTTTNWYFDESGKLVKYNKPAPEFVGDIVLADGTAITGKYASKMSDSEKSSAVAVIFYSGNTFGTLGARMLGVGLKKSGTLAWAKSGTTGYNTSFDRIVSSASNFTASDDTDGSDNWDEICAVDPTGTANAATNYPAFNWANNYGETVNIDTNNKYYSNWFIPTIAEATQLWTVHNDVNTIIQNLGGDEVASNDSWWTSSQVSGTSNKSKAYARYSSNPPQTTDKIYPYYVHVIHEFGATIAPDPITISTKDYSGEIDVNYQRTKNGSYYIYTFTVDTTNGEYDSYLWSVDGNEKSNATDYYSTTSTLSIDTSLTSVWKQGIYDIMVIAKKGSRYYSWSTQLTIASN